VIEASDLIAKLALSLTLQVRRSPGVSRTQHSHASIRSRVHRFITRRATVVGK
jgi:hypothetical protein